MHQWFFARLEGQGQLYGSWLPVWDDLLPEYPADLADADAAVVADALMTSSGGSSTPRRLIPATFYPRPVSAVVGERAYTLWDVMLSDELLVH